MMKRKSRLAIAAFILLFLVQLGFLLHACLRNGLEPEVVFSGFALFLVGAVFWAAYLIFQRRFRGVGALITVGLLLASAYESYFPYAPLGALWKQHAANRVTLSNYQETYRLSKQGNPIGIQITYDMVFPVSGSYYLNTEFQAVNPALQHYNLQMASIAAKMRVEPAAQYDWLAAKRFESGTVYHFTEEIAPGFLFEALYDDGPLKQGDLCILEKESESLSAGELRRLIESDAASRHALWIEVRSNNYLTTPHTVLNRETAEYPPRTFLLSAQQERAPVCVLDPRTGWPVVKIPMKGTTAGGSLCETSPDTCGCDIPDP